MGARRRVVRWLKMGFPLGFDHDQVLKKMGCPHYNFTLLQR